jgi:hypothetical protein
MYVGIIHPVWFQFEQYLKNNILFLKFGFTPQQTLKLKIMNLKRIFGGLLTVLGIGSLIYAAVLFINDSGGTNNIKALVIYGMLGLIFFIAGISLIRTTKDES